VATEDRTDLRTASLSAYVDLPLAEVLQRFAAPEIDELLTASVQAALSDGGEPSFSAHASAPEWHSAHSARVAVTWSTAGRSGPEREGAALVSLLTVRSGRDAITELLVALPLGDDHRSSATITLHRILDEITSRLEAAAR
jgi:hypothetical protein